MTQPYKSLSFIVLTALITNAFSTGVTALFEPPPQASPESLSLIVLKMTGEEYVMLKNNSSADINDLSIFSLKAFNNFNPSVSNVAVTSQSLPALSLNQSETLLLSSTIRPTCGASLAGKLSVSLVDGSGRLEIIKNQVPLKFGSPEIIDSVSWSSATSGQIKSVPSSSKSPLTVYYRTQTADNYNWQMADAEPSKPCQLNVAVPGNTAKSQVVLTSDELAIPQSVKIEAIPAELTDNETEVPAILLPVQISELLPNPKGSGNDSTDEYIELYNPNETDFDLSRFKLQTGISRLENFTFNPGTILPAKTHKAYYASETGLGLSNTLGQARLLFPSGESLSLTDVYRSAKDGQSWSLIGAVWSWSESTTPNAPNMLALAKTSDKKAVSAASNLSKKAAREPVVKKPKPAKAPKAAKPAKPKKIKVEKSTKYSSGPDEETLMARPIQTKLVATVGSVALLYGAYEYRSSLANGFYKLRRKFGFGG